MVRERSDERLIDKGRTVMRSPRIGIVALGACNLRSVEAALERSGAQPVIVNRPSPLAELNAIVLPGVSNVGFAAREIDERDFRVPLTSAIAADVPLLGICAGFQLLFSGSEEAPEARGFNVFPGIVRALRGPKRQHVGWNRVEGATVDGWAYFAHAFAADVCQDAVATTTFGAPFTSIARSKAVLGVQFHPERSGAFGAAMIARWVEEVRCARVG